MSEFERKVKSHIKVALIISSVFMLFFGVIFSHWLLLGIPLNYSIWTDFKRVLNKWPQY